MRSCLLALASGLVVAACSAHPRADAPVEGGSHQDAGPGDAAAEDTAPRDAGPSDSGDVDVGSEAGAPPLTAMTVRVERPRVVRGPRSDEMDQPFSEILLGNGSWRAFTANGTTYSIDAPTQFAIGGARTTVLSPGPPGSYSECGEWLNEARRFGSSLWGFVHCEMDCNYPIGQTHKSMAIATSTDDGHSWKLLGQFLTSTQAPKTGTITGEGDCTAIDGHDGYAYAYCLRDSDWSTIVARAPVTDLSPGKWKKFDGQGWSVPSLGGTAAPLGGLGTASAWWTSRDGVFLADTNATKGGVMLSVSSDRTTFTTFAEPLVPLDADNWARPAPSELYAYLSFIGKGTATNDVGDDFYLANVYLQPGATFSSRYYVIREVVITRTNADPGAPRVGIALTRWNSATAEDRWTTTAPVPGNGTDYVVDKSLGYLMTKPPAGADTAKLEDCVSTWPGHPDHLLTDDGQCAKAGYTRLRTAGWVYKTQQPGTAPLYRCYDSTRQCHFAATTPDCDGIGKAEWQLGYLLAK